MTRARLERIITRSHGLDYSTLHQPMSKMPIDRFMKLIVFSTLPNVFAQWVRRIILIGRRETDSMSEDMQCLATDSPGNAINRALSAYLCALYDTEAMDMSLARADSLYRASQELCDTIEECMRRNPPTTTTTTTTQRARKVMQALDSFLNIHQEWVLQNNHIVLRRLASGAIMRMHELIGSQRLAMADQQFGLYAIRSIATTGNADPIRRILFDSPAMRVMRRMADNEFWGAHGMHTSRFMHELLIDPEFKLTMDQTIPALSRKYSAKRRIWSVTELLLDAGTVIMWECRSAEDIIALAEAIDLDASPGLLNDIPATVERIRRVVCRLVPNTSGDIQYAMELQSIGTGGRAREPLERLLHYALVLRHAWANARVDKVRELSNGANVEVLASFLNRFDPQRFLSSPTTRNWVQAAVLRCDRTTLTTRLAHGDSFALLKLHDHAIIDTVLENAGRVLEIGSVPDILYLDLDRLRIICSMLHCAQQPGFGALFRELVTSGEDLSHTLSTQVVEAATKLRTVVFVCRCRYGNTVARMAWEMARAIASVSDLQRLTLGGERVTSPLRHESMFIQNSG